MSRYGQSRPLDAASDASSSTSSVSVRQFRDHNTSTATSSSTSPHALELPDDSDQDPSFSSQRVVTSTPRRKTRLDQGEEREEERDDELRDSDTESINLLNDRAIEQGIERFEEEQQQARLTRKSLASHLQDERYYYSSSNSLTPKGISVPQQKFIRGELYAPSPSTGSSTLVEREEEGTFTKLDSSRRAGADKVARRTAIQEEDVVYEEEEEDQRAELRSSSRNRNPEEEEEEDGSSSSPRPAASRRSTVGNLATYIDARLSSSSSTTPRRSPKSRRQQALPPQTPHAPGAFPSSTRKPRSSSPPFPSETPLTSHASTRQQTPPSNGSSSSQIHDAFAKFITGPKGALTNSAERRIALQANSTPGPSSSPNLKATGDVKRERERVVETPDFAGRYSFVPTSTLPVDKGHKNGKGKGRADERGLEPEPARPTNLESALRRVGTSRDREESEFVQRRRQEYEQRPASRQGQIKEEQEEEEVEIPTSEEDEVRIAQRSAIDFAMARSFIAEPEEVLSRSEAEASGDDEHQRRTERRSTDFRSSVRFAEPAPRSPSPPPAPAPPRQRSHLSTSLSRSSTTPRTQPRPLSPELPPLPPLLAPDSPEPVRNLPPSAPFRRSHSVSRRPSSLREPLIPDAPSTPPRQPVFEPSPLRSPSPPASPPPIDPPKSSTPPRRTVQPPNPDDTPPRASPSPLARRIKSSPKRIPSPPLSPTFHSFVEPRPSDERQLIEMEEQEIEEDASIPLLVNQLSAAVRALTTAHTSPKSPARRARKSSGGTSSEVSRDQLARELARRKTESDRKRRELEEELLQLESRDQAELARRDDLANQLAETYEIEHELGCKVEELRKSIEEMGQLVGDQVAQAVNQSFTGETRKRAHWLALAFCFQLGLFWILLRLANHHSSALLHDSYYDPFQPPTFHLPLNPYASPDALHPDTIALFTPYVSSHTSWSGLETTASILKSSVERFGKLASTWSASRSTFSGSSRLVLAARSQSVPV